MIKDRRKTHGRFEKTAESNQEAARRQKRFAALQCRCPAISRHSLSFGGTGIPS